MREYLPAAGCVWAASLRTFEPEREYEQEHEHENEAKRGQNP